MMRFWQVFSFDMSVAISAVTFCCRGAISISGKWSDLNVWVVKYTGIISHISWYTGRLSTVNHVSVSKHHGSVQDLFNHTDTELQQQQNNIHRQN